MKIMLIICSLVLISCNNTISEPHDSVVPFGKWGFVESDSTTDIYEKVEEFDHTQGGITFAQNGVFYIRSFGFCGTPPIAYYDVEGQWELIDDSLFQITYSEDWFEINSESTIEIISLSGNELHIIWDHL